MAKPAVTKKKKSPPPPELSQLKKSYVASPSGLSLASENLPRRQSSRPRRPKSYESLLAHQPISSRCWTWLPKMLLGYAMQTML